MKIIIPVRGAKTDILFTDYNKFRSDFLNLKNNSSLLENLNEVINGDIGSDPTDLINKIVISEINFFEQEKVFENKKFEKPFKESGKFIWGEMMVIDTLVNYPEKINLTFYNPYNNLAEKLLSTLAIIANLTYELPLDFMGGFIFNSENQLVGKTELHYNHIESAYFSSYEIKWPSLKGLELSTTLNWLINNQIKLYGLSNSKASRALNAFSQVFDNLEQRDKSYLFWCVLGIECLLAEGTSNLANQIKTKCNIILGEPKEFKKKLSKLYNYRSRFIHGNIEIPISHDLNEKTFEGEYIRYLDFAISILLALLRELIKNNKTEFKFEYKYCS